MARQREERKKQALLEMLLRRRGAIEGKPIPEGRSRRLAGWILALKSGYGDLADYHERSKQENSVWCPYGEVPFTRARIVRITRPKEGDYLAGRMADLQKIEKAETLDDGKSHRLCNMEQTQDSSGLGEKG